MSFSDTLIDCIVLYCIVVIGLDYVAAGNFTSIPIPKYNNKVQNPDIFDKSTRVLLPRSMLQVPTSTGEYS